MYKQKRTGPTLCPHCAKAGRKPCYVHEPPAWVKALFTLRSGIKGDRTGTCGTVKQVAERLGISRQRACLLMDEAADQGAIYLDRITNLHEIVYRKTNSGKQLLQSWVRAGWDPTKARVSQREARKR